MIKAILIAALILGFTDSFAQSTQNMTVKQSREAQYAQGDAAVDQYFFDNLHYSDEAKHAKVDTEVMLSFMVEKDSTISNIKVIRDPGFGIGERLKELLSRMKYIPAIENGVTLRSKVILNVPVRAH
ncbi:MAG TPA: energy transducer TonB [Cytophagaceae bacterium]|jgi:protein TonB|nr:energy transducer TonB [Cytophagaceae bacterium]